VPAFVKVVDITPPIAQTTAKQTILVLLLLQTVPTMAVAAAAIKLCRPADAVTPLNAGINSEKFTEKYNL